MFFSDLQRSTCGRVLARVVRYLSIRHAREFVNFGLFPGRERRRVVARDPRGLLGVREVRVSNALFQQGRCVFSVLFGQGRETNFGVVGSIIFSWVFSYHANLEAGLCLVRGSGQLTLLVFFNAKCRLFSRVSFGIRG